jgi:hypothetical protein
MTVLQRDVALAKANEIRIGKANLKRDLSLLSKQDGLKRAAHWVEHDYDDTVIGSFRVAELVGSCPRCGQETVRRALRHAGIVNGQRRIRSLTDRQREALAFALRNRSALFPTTGLDWD